MTEIAVLVPALARPRNVVPLQESLRSSLRACHARLVYLLSPGDSEQLEVVRATGLDYLIVEKQDRGDYAAKINAGVRATNEEWLLLAADDLKFHRGWADEALKVAKETGCRVIGTNDLGNRLVMAGRHSTHTLVHRDYTELGTIDDPSRLLHEGYHHNWVDTEFIATAKARGEFTFAKQSVVEHLHPNWRKGVMDETYRLGLSTFEQDRRLYRKRERLWKRNLGFRTPQKGVSQQAS